MAAEIPVTLKGIVVKLFLTSIGEAVKLSFVAKAPKVVAEAMFWGCVPIASPVSCVPFMMGNGSRGVILQEELNQDVDQIEAVISKQVVYQKMASEGQTWSRQFTTDKFEAEIKKLLRG